MKKYDKQHINNIRRYQRKIDKIYKTAAEEIAQRAAGLPAPEDDIFSLDDHPRIMEAINALMDDMRKQISFTITDGVKAEWDLSNAKNDDMVDDALAGRAKAAEAVRWYRQNIEARDAFLSRVENGLKLSDRVWNYTNQFKQEIELGLDCGIRDGLDAPAMARQLKQYLKYPDKLFRRVRDEHGILRLSKRAAAFHPGRGVYRSSYKNARRLAATETNMAYRQADYDRWQQLEMVVGLEIRLSNNHTCLNNEGKAVAFYDICDELKGRYPKDFKFVGWHPHCRCIVTPIKKSREEIDADIDRLLDGQPALPSESSENYVSEMPEGWDKWMENNQDRLSRAKSMPYFIRDNFKDGDPSQGLRWLSGTATEPRKLTALEIAEQRHAARTPEREAEILNEWYTRQTMNLFEDMHNGLLPDVTDNINEIFNSIALEDWGDARKRISLLQAASRRHAARTAEQVAAIRRMWEERTLLPVTQWSATSTKAELGTIADAAAKQSVDYLEVKLLDKTLTGDEIIAKLAGGDLTKGSCSSLAFSYCGNRAGLDVTDFRGGASCSFFSRTANIKEIVSKAGGTVVSNASDFTNAKQLLAKVEVGKEYYFTCGQHAAMVRKTNQGFEFLELQSSMQNGWKKLDDNILRYRFGAKRSHSTYGHKYNGTDCIIEVEKLAEDKEFKKLLGYINTNAAKQMKGIKGSIK